MKYFSDAFIISLLTNSSNDNYFIHHVILFHKTYF